MKSEKEADNIPGFSKERRDFLRLAGAAGLLMITPGCLAEAVKMADPQGQSKDLQKAVKILEGAGAMAASAGELDYQSEFAIGETLALEGFRRYGLPVKDSGVQKYVSLVGNAVARNSARPNIPFYFVLVNSPIYNAFSCPGGIIFVSSALVRAMEDESQLAGVLAHEAAHVGHRHALQSVKRAKFFEGVAKIGDAAMKGEKGKKFKEMIGTLQNVLFDRGLDQNMEYEADMSGMEIAYRTGYDPEGLIKVLEILNEKEATARKEGSWFSTHPPLSARIARCRERMKKYPDAGSLASVRERFAFYRNRF
jgi:predicted Zn-dependent protease